LIKISKGLYIHYTTVLFFVICWFTRRLELLFISYFTAFLHESAHLLAALLIGIEPKYIAFFPFGVNLRIKSRIIYSISDEIILYMSGPLLNAVFALFTQIFMIKYSFGSLFYWNNIGLFLFNLLPVLPLDGATILKRILSDKIGNKFAEKFLKAVSITLILILVSIEIVFVIKSSFNFSILFIVVFLTANIFTNTEKYSVNFLKELIYIKKKSKRDFARAEVYLISEDCDKRKLAENFNAAKSYVIMKRNKSGKISEIMTEEAVIDSILNHRA